MAAAAPVPFALTPLVLTVPDLYFPSRRYSILTFEDRPADMTAFFDRKVEVLLPSNQTPPTLLSHRVDGCQISLEMQHEDREKREIRSLDEVKEKIKHQSKKALLYFSLPLDLPIDMKRKTEICLTNLSFPSLPYTTASASTWGDRPYNEDRALSGILSPTLSYIATLDGHGQKYGVNKALDFLVGGALHEMLDTLLSPLKEKPNADEDIVLIWNALKKLFVHLQEKFDHSFAPGHRSGVVGVVTLFRKLDDGNIELWTANLGDCGGLFIDMGIPRIAPISWDATLSDLEILRSVYKRGGVVYIPSPIDACYRVPFLSKENTLIGGVNMGRSFGDDPIHVSRRAKVTRGVFNPSKGSCTVVQFSDGYSSVMSGEDANKHLASLIKEGRSPDAIAHASVERAYQKGSSDNIIVTVAHFPKSGT